MKSLQEINKKTILLYYEYDHKKKIYTNISSEGGQEKEKEFIKLTYLLSSAQVPFFIDNEKNIILDKKNTIFTRFIHLLSNKLFKIKNENKNIYLLNDTRMEYAKNIPLIQINYLPIEINFSQYDGIIFTSKNSVKAIDSMSKEWKKLPSYVISKKTAQTIKEYGGKIQYISKSNHGESFAYELIDKLQTKNILFIGAKKVASNLEEILNSNGVNCDYKAIYETTCVEYEKKITLPKNSIIIFSSPSTINCFLKNINWDKSFKAISIGKTTEKYFPEYINPITADNPSLHDCIQKALSL